MMSTLGKLKEFLTCGICLGLLKEPKILDCLHRFCEACIHKHILQQNQEQLRYDQGFCCPTCRHKTAVSNSKRSPQKWAARLQTDTGFKNLVQFVQTQANMPQGQNVFSGSYHLCPVHPDEKNDLYCNDCACVICHLCAGTTHRKCAEVVVLVNAANERRLKAQESVHHTLAKLKETLTSLESCGERVSEIKGLRTNAEAAIKERANTLKKTLAQAEAKLLHVLDERCKSIEENIIGPLGGYNDKFVTMKKNLASLSGNLRSLSDHDLLSGDVIEKAKGSVDDGDSEIKACEALLDELSDVRLTFQSSSGLNISLGTLVAISEREDPNSLAAQQAKGEVALSKLRTLREAVATGGVTTGDDGSLATPESAVSVSDTSPAVKAAAAKGKDGDGCEDDLDFHFGVQESDKPTAPLLSRLNQAVKFPASKRSRSVYEYFSARSRKQVPLTESPPAP